MRSRSARLAVVSILSAIWPSLALACAVCGGGGDSPRTQAAFFDTTIWLSLLPLGMIGGGLWWLKREGRGWLGEEFEVRHSFPPREGAESGEGEDETEPRA